MVYGLGIDIGTTFTAAATWDGARASVLPLGRRSDAVPTVLFLATSGEWVIGDAAERRTTSDPDRVVRGFKRRMGDDVPLQVAGRAVTAVDLTAAVISWVVSLATDREGEPPSRLVLTLPAEWGAFRLDRMRQAAVDAGQPAAEFVPEPVAAAIYYGAQRDFPLGATVGVFDLGGGTFDAALVRRSASGFTIHGKPAGDAGIGGLDIDDAVMAHVRTSLGEGWDLLDLDGPDTMSGLLALRADLVLAKEALSDDVETSIAVLLPGLVRTVRMTRAELEGLSADQVERAVDTFVAMLRQAGVEPRDLAAVLLVGGGSRMPLVAERLTGALGVRATVDAHPKYAVCLGAAMVAGARLAGSTATVGELPARELRDTPPPGPAPDDDSPQSEVGRPTARSPVMAARRRAAPPVRDRAPVDDTTPVGGGPGRRRSRVQVAADLALTGLVTPELGTSELGTSELVPPGSPGPGQTRAAPGTRTDEPLVIRTGGGSRRVPVAAVVAAIVLVAAALVLVLVVG